MDTLRIGLRAAKGLVVPLLAAGVITAGSPGFGSYTVKNGDTLSHIAQRYGTTVRALVELNNIPGSGNHIIAGDVLRIPLKAQPKPQHSYVVYVIKRGDTIGQIAKRYKVEQSTLLAANGLNRNDRIIAGERLRIPVKKRNDTFLGRKYPDSVVAAADRNRAILAKRKLPTRGQIRATIIATAERHGVDPELALAIAWQESGWKQRVVSPANAVGTMQVIPSTGRFVSSIVGRDLDLLRTKDNITAGVVLIDRLTGAAELSVAIAGYYQGLGGVRKNGMYPDTKRYVESVLLIKQRLERGWDPLR